MSEARMTTLVAPILERLGLELERLEVVPAGRRSIVRVTVDGDGPHGRGPLLDDIATASQQISSALDESDVVSAPSYTLEVSSRGLSSPLTQPKHYRRNLTRLLRVTLRDGRSLEGRLVEASDTGIVLEVTPESVKGNRNPKPVRHELALDDVTKAVVQVELNRSLSAELDSYDGGDDAEDDDADEVSDDTEDDEVSDDEPDDDEPAGDELADDGATAAGPDEKEN